MTSGEGCSTKSISPLCNAAAAVAGSGMEIHSIRSTIARLAPARPSGSSARGR